jgi:hypothetical protein
MEKEASCSKLVTSPEGCTYKYNCERQHLLKKQQINLSLLFYAPSQKNQ